MQRRRFNMTAIFMWSLLLFGSFAINAVCASKKFNYLADSTKMIRVVYRVDDPTALKGSILLTPKVVWRSGVTYLRTNEMPDSSNGLHLTFVVSEPDVWVVNWIGKQGQHAVDPGPTYIAHIYACDSEGSASDKIEIGMEQAFFEQCGAMESGNEIVDSVLCTVLECSTQEASYRLYVRADTNTPRKLSQKKKDGTVNSILYDEYVTGLPFDSSLFLPPEEVKFIEQ